MSFFKVNLVISIALVVVVLAQSTRAEQQMTREIEEQQVADQRAAEGKYLAFSPALLSRFIYSFRPSERQSSPLAAVSSGPVVGYKRSSSAFDALSANVLGKRSAPTVGSINYEPLLNRPFSTMRPTPRGAYDIRWAPFEALEGANQIDYN